MAKSDKHKKRRRQDKAKTQLTGSGIRKLAKAQNLYEPTIRAKKIIIREQLKTQADVKDGDKDEVEVTTRRKQNIKDILSALNHHNTNIKKDALNGLQELISSQGEILHSNLDRILGKIAGLTSELEDSVRKENLKVAEVIFANTTEEQVQPFWNLLLTHVNCGLTNLNPSIRYGCLSFLSLLVSYFPTLVSRTNHIILPSILTLVSAISPTTSKTSAVKGGDKSHLKIEIDTKERIRVLSLITSCLDLSDAKRPKSTNRDNVNSLEASWGATDNNLNGMYSVGGYQDFSTEWTENGGTSGNFSTQSVLSNGILNNNVNVGIENDSSQSEDFWPQFVQSYIPLLCETWMEIRPSCKGDNRGSSEFSDLGDRRGVSSLPTPAVEILECIVTVMIKLIVQFRSSNSLETQSEGQLSLVKILRKKQGQTIKRYFFDWLPFSAVQDSQKKTVTTINLRLFHIAAQLRLFDEDLMSRLEIYLNSLMKKSNLDTKQISVALQIIPLLHMPNIGQLSSKIITYALSAGSVDIIYAFLIQVLSTTHESNGASILNTIEWSGIISQLIESTCPVTPELLSIFVLIGLRKFVDLKLELSKNVALHKIKQYLEKNESDNDAWERVVRLYHVSGCLELIEQISVSIPTNIGELLKHLN